MRLTKNFSSGEFDCKDGTPVPEIFLSNLKELANNLQVLRDFLKKPITITGSGYRTPSHNKNVGGAPKSQHLTASAADINATDMTPKELGSVIDKLIANGSMKEGGLGIYKQFVHYDIRGKKSRW
ncbi:MAG: DUF882 domain-containing protein [Pedobacter sp.]|nr:MAG: DUF882 domain-containing protein [Pedobacter sp.]